MPGSAQRRDYRPGFDERLAVSPAGLGASALHSAGPRSEASNGRPAWLGSAAGMLDGIGGLGWSVIGFVVGAVFWHFIGFWGFVSEVVLAGGPSVPAPSRMYMPVLSESRPNPVQVADAAPCTLLILDRRTGVTSAGACEEGGSALSADAFQGREDRVVASSGIVAAE